MIQGLTNIAPDQYFKVLLVKQSGFLAWLIRKATKSEFNHIAISDPFSLRGYETEVVVSFDPIKGLGRYLKPSGWTKMKTSGFRYKSHLEISEFTNLNQNVKYSFWHSFKAGVFHWFPKLRKLFGNKVSPRKTNCVGFIVRFLNLPSAWEYDTPEELFDKLNSTNLTQSEVPVYHGGYVLVIGENNV